MEYSRGVGGASVGLAAGCVAVVGAASVGEGSESALSLLQAAKLKIRKEAQSDMVAVNSTLEVPPCLMKLAIRI